MYVKNLIICLFFIFLSSNVHAYKKEACLEIENFLTSGTDRDIPKPLDVWVDLNLKEIQKIDGKNQSFTAGYEYKITWEDNASLDLAKSIFGDESYGCMWEESDRAFLEFNFFRPAFGFTNKLSYDEDQEFKEIQFAYYPTDENYSAAIWMTVRATGVSSFKTEFNYRSFPFDQQKIEFGLINYDSVYRGTWGHDYINIKMTQKDPDLLLKYSKNTVSGWQVGKPILEKITQKIDNDGSLTTIANLNQEITRNSIYYIFKVISPIFIILVICWSVFWTSAKELESRLTVTIVCFLSLIAYNYVIDDELPKLAYLTLMDYIILCSYIFAAIPSILSIIAHRNYQNSGNEFIKLDRWTRFTGPLLFLAIVYILVVIITNNNIDHSGNLLRNISF